MDRRLSRLILAVWSLVALGLIGSAQGEVVPARTVALSGQHAPGTEDGVVFYIGESFFPAGIDASGRTAFLGPLAGPGVEEHNDSGIWSESSGTLMLVAREGDPAPGTESGVVFDLIELPQISSAGHVAFRSRLAGPGMDDANNFGIWSNGSGTLLLVARTGSPAPGTLGDLRFSALGEPLINEVGEVAFVGEVSGTEVDEYNREGIWSESSGTLELIARGGEPAVGTRVVFRRFHVLAFNAAGAIAFDASLQSLEGVGPDGGIWEGLDELELVALSGQPGVEGIEPAPGTAANFNSLFTNIVNDAAGRVAFAATVGYSPTVDDTTDTGVWSGTPTSLESLAREGDPAPGTSEGVSFGDFDGNFSVVINDGRVAFNAELTGAGVDDTNLGGIWSQGFGPLALVARDGGAAPGTDTTFFGVGFPALNAAGQIAFGASLTSSESDGGVWMQDADGAVRLVVRDGDQIEGLGTIVFAGVPEGEGGEGGRSTYFNGAGQIVFVATISGGSDAVDGVFVTPPGTNGGDGDGGGAPTPGSPQCGAMCGAGTVPFMIVLLAQCAIVRRWIRRRIRAEAR